MRKCDQRFLITAIHCHDQKSLITHSDDIQSIGNTDTAGNRYDGQLGCSARWSGNTKVGLDLFILGIMRMIMMIRMIMMMRGRMIMMMRRNFHMGSPKLIWQPWLLYWLSWLSWWFSIWMRKWNFSKGWIALENGNGKDFLTTMEQNSRR